MTILYYLYIRIYYITLDYIFFIPTRILLFIKLQNYRIYKIHSKVSRKDRKNENREKE